MSAFRTRSRELSRELSLKIHQLGVGGTIAFSVRRFIQELLALATGRLKDSPDFDLKYGTDTRGIIRVGGLDVPADDAKHAGRYQTAIPGVFVEILNQLPIRFEDFSFIDLGSGKGRVLLEASSFPFQKIIGVELAPSLHAIACENISIYRGESQRCYNITPFCGNAVAFEIPLQNLVFYLFNPFDGEVLRAVLDRLEESLRQRPRTMYVLVLESGLSLCPRQCRELRDF